MYPALYIHQLISSSYHNVIAHAGLLCSARLAAILSSIPFTQLTQSCGAVWPMMVIIPHVALFSRDPDLQNEGFLFETLDVKIA